jgi:predicted lipid-binding transport protein (Tim44 family)
VVLVPAGYPLAAAFFCAGLALGLLNTTMVQRSAARFAAMGNPSKKRFAGSVLGRLALITVLGIAVLVQPEGLGVFAGLAAFQLLMIFMASIPLLRELREQSAAEDQSGAGQSGVKV